MNIITLYLKSKPKVEKNIIIDLQYTDLYILTTV